MLRVREEEGEPWGVGIWGLQRAFLSLGQHGGIDVTDRNGGGGVVIDGIAMMEEAEGYVTGSASDVEHFPGCRRGGGGNTGVERADEVVSKVVSVSPEKTTEGREE